MSDEETPVDGEEETVVYFGKVQKKVNWLKVRTFYIMNPDVNITQTAKKFGLSITGVHKKATKEGWKDLRAANYSGSQEILEDQIADKIVQARIQHSIMTGGVVRILQKLVNEIETYGFVKADGSEITSTMTKAEILLSLSNAAMKASEADRLNLGLKPGDVGDDEHKETTLEIIQRTLSPEKIKVNEEGRVLDSDSADGSVAV